MPIERADPLITIKLNGTAVSAAFMRSLQLLEVDSSLHLPSMMTLTLRDDDLKWTDNTSLLKIGAAVVIEVTAAQQGGRAGADGTLFDGEVTALETQYEFGGAATLVLTGYSKSHRLHRGRKVRTFLNMTDSAILSKIAQEAGLSATITATSVKHPYVMQANQSDWEFMQARAARIGYRIFVEGAALKGVKVAATPSTGDVTLSWGEELLRFQPRLSAAQQAQSVKVRGWDPKTKKEVVGTSSQTTLVPIVGPGSNGATKTAFGNADYAEVAAPMAMQSVAQAYADTIASDFSGRLVQAEGESVGDPRLLAGKTVKVEGVGTRFGGTYTVTSATHRYDTVMGYTTLFAINGRDANTLYATLNPPTATATPGRIYGVVVGLVTNNKDPEGMGRVKVKFPWLSDTEESDWARQASPMAGPQRGFFYMPEVNDEVLVAFEHGDVNTPYIVGALWNGKDKPPLPTEQAVSGGKVARRLIKTTAGHQILLVDQAGQESIEIIDKTGKNKIIIDSVMNKITVAAEGDMAFTAKGNCNFDVTGNFNVKAKMKVAIEGTAGAEVKTNAQLKLTGVAGSELSSTGPTAVKGSLLQIQASGPATVKGNPIMLN